MSSTKFMEVKISSDRCAIVLDIDESTKITVTNGLTGHGLETSASSMLITTRSARESSDPATSTSSADSTSDVESSEYVCENNARAVPIDEESGTSDSAEASASDEGSNDADAEDSTNSTNSTTTTSDEESNEAQPTQPPLAKRRSGKARNANTGPHDNLTTRAKGSSNPVWTLSHDTLLKNMKEGGETWASIAAALGRAKKDVQRRFKELTAHDGKPNKGKKGQGSTTSGNHSKFTLEDSDSETQQQLYLQEQIKENLYPPYLNLKPDDKFTKRDCQVLATVDSKMKRGRWLEMQANFYNATGQMLPISVFKDKCEAAEAEQRTRMTNEKIKAWKARLDQFKQLDPNAPSGHIAGFA